MKHKLFLLAALFAALAVPLDALAYDFSAVAPSGQTLYYNIVDGGVQVTSQNGEYPYYSSYPTEDLVIPSSVANNGNTYSVTSIGNKAFYSCSGLTSVTIPNSVISIGSEAFCYCSGLTSVTIGNSVTTIGIRAFEGCSGLTSVSIPESVTNIGVAVFVGCSGLTSIVVAEGNTHYDSRDNSNAIIQSDLNPSCAGLQRHCYSQYCNRHRQQCLLFIQWVDLLDNTQFGN